MSVGLVEDHVIGLQQIPIGQDHRALNDVLEFPNVPRPGIAEQLLAGWAANAPHECPELIRIPAEEEVGQIRDVLPAFPQRSQPDGNNVQPVEQVGPEASGLHGLAEISVAGGQHPDIGQTGLPAADGAELFLLKKSEQFDLSRQRETVDFIQEQRSPLGFGHQAVGRPLRAGVGARRVAEKFVLHEVQRESAAVHRNERTLQSRTEPVQRAGEQFLSGAGFPGDEHAGLATRQGRQLAQLGHQRRTATHNMTETQPILHRLKVLIGSRAGLAGFLQVVLQSRQDIHRPERRHQEVAESLVQRGEKGVGFTVRRDQEPGKIPGKTEPLRQPGEIDRAGGSGMNHESRHR